MPEATPVIVLNGGSSSGKSSIARALQEVLPGCWLTFGVDAFIEALPGHGDGPGANIDYRPDGTISLGPAFRARERAWYQGLAAMARAGAPLILDEVFLDGAAGYAPLAVTLRGLTVTLVGVRCDPATAGAREAQRPDRISGMARDQADRVHAGMRYDIEVDTARATPQQSARLIAAHVTG